MSAKSNRIRYCCFARERVRVLDWPSSLSLFGELGCVMMFMDVPLRRAQQVCDPLPCLTKVTRPPLRHFVLSLRPPASATTMVRQAYPPLPLSTPRRRTTEKRLGLLGCRRGARGQIGHVQYRTVCSGPILPSVRRGVSQCTATTFVQTRTYIFRM